MLLLQSAYCTVYIFIMHNTYSIVLLCYICSPHSTYCSMRTSTVHTLIIEWTSILLLFQHIVRVYKISVPNIYDIVDTHFYLWGGGYKFGSVFGLRIQIHKVAKCGSNLDRYPQHLSRDCPPLCGTFHWKSETQNTYKNS